MRYRNPRFTSKLYLGRQSVCIMFHTTNSNTHYYGNKHHKRTHGKTILKLNASSEPNGIRHQ